MPRPKILIAEGDRELAGQLEAALTRLDYDVAGIAASGPEAIRLAAETRPNLVVMEIDLAGDMDGIETARKVRERWSLASIFLAGYVDPATLSRAKASEPFGYLVLPVSERALQAAIEIALNKQEAEAKVRAIEKWFAASMERIGDGVIVTADVSGTVCYLNRVAESLLGWHYKEAVGKKVGDIFKLVDPQTGEPLPDPMEGILRESVVSDGNGILLVTKTGEQIPVDHAGVCLRDAEGKPTGVILIIRDARERADRDRMLQQITRTQFEFEAAQAVQGHMLPKDAPALLGFDIAGACQPAEAIGGDYFDFVSMAGARLGIVVADVVGHSFASALIMACTRRALRIFAKINANPGSVLTSVNEALAEDTDPEHFVTLFLGCFDAATQQFIYAGAGHPAYLFDLEGQVFCLGGTGLPLGITHDTVYASMGPIQMLPGQMVVVLTDGFQEAFAPNGQSFGLPAVLEFIRRHAHQPAQDILDGLMTAVKSFCAPGKPPDDMTIVVIKRLSRR